MAIVETKVENKIGWLVLNRPEKLNALSLELLDAFEVALDELADDPDVSVIVIRGEGRAFTVGYDVDRQGDYDQADTGDNRTHTWDDWQALDKSIDRWLHITRIKKPVISAVHGYCMGGGTMLSACCDLTVIAEDAVVGWPTVPLGGGLIGVMSLVHLGPKKAAEMSFIVGSSLDGVEAVEQGWANYAVPADQVIDRVTKLANRVARTPVEMLILKKAAIRRTTEMMFNFTTTVRSGAEFDAIAHDSHAIEETRAIIAEIGLKGAIAEFTKEEA
jgi:enoyl-CoA hydratase